MKTHSSYKSISGLRTRNRLERADEAGMSQSVHLNIRPHIVINRINHYLVDSVVCYEPHCIAFYLVYSAVRLLNNLGPVLSPPDPRLPRAITDALSARRE